MKLLVNFNDAYIDEEIVSDFYNLILTNNYSSNLVFADFSSFIQKITFKTENEFEVYGVIPKVDYFKCKFCTACLNSCNTEAFGFDKILNTIKIRPENCIECFNCFSKCKSKGGLLKDKYLFAKVESMNVTENCMLFKFVEMNCLSDLSIFVAFSRLVSNYFEARSLSVLFAKKVNVSLRVIEEIIDISEYS